MNARLSLFITMLSASTAAFACGVCIEDRVAATYDHAVVVKAAADHRVMVFAAVDGQAPAKVLAASAQRAAARIEGVDPASVRSSAEPAGALSFALDPSVRTPESAISAIARASTEKGLRLTLLKVVP